MAQKQMMIWPPFVRLSLGLALTGGFGLGGLAFAFSALGLPLAQWSSIVQVHGHLQLLGWVGLMVWGVGLHFLPRLRGRPLAHPARAQLALWLFAAGLLLRFGSQIILATGGAGAWRSIVWLIFAASGVLEFSGGGLLGWTLAQTLGGGENLRQRAGFWQVMPFLLTAGLSFGLSLGCNLVGVLVAFVGRDLVLGRLYATLAEDVALIGFLLPITLGMSVRLFPLYLRTPLALTRLLYVGLALLLVGLSCGLVGVAFGLSGLSGLGAIVQGIALLGWVWGVQIFAPRRPLPRPGLPLWRDATQWHAITAYGWLVVSALALIALGLSAFGRALLPVSADLVRHLLGSGLLTILIFGIGPKMFEGFSRRPIRHPVYCWLTLVLGNLATVLRLGPALSLSPRIASMLGALAGLAGLLAVLFFSWNLWAAIWNPRRD